MTPKKNQLFKENLLLLIYKLDPIYSEEELMDEMSTIAPPQLSCNLNPTWAPPLAA